MKSKALSTQQIYLIALGLLLGVGLVALVLWLNWSKPSRNLTLLATGDIMLAREVENRVLRADDFTAPFEFATELIRSADLAFANLETPLFPGPMTAAYHMIFRADPRFALALKQVGWDVFSLSNNHAGDAGQPGLNQTLDELERVGIKTVGTGKTAEAARQPLVIEKNGLKIAYLAYTDKAISNFKGETVNFMSIENLKADLKTVRPRADLVIVSMHAGVEYQNVTPSQKQVEFAHTAIEYGADLVLGHHPHVLQPIEEYQGKLIFYSLGNFVFDQMQFEATREAVLVKFHFNNRKLDSLEFFPYVIYDYYLPKPVEGKQASKILNRLSSKIHLQPELTWQAGEIQVQSKWVYELAGSNFQSDLNANGQLETYNLAEGQVTVSENEQVLWQSPAEYKVDHMTHGDLNHDGKEDLILTLWKEGSYGPSQPFWIKERDESYAQHLFFYTWDGDQLQLSWGSSNLEAPLTYLNARDLDQDGKTDLIAGESTYTDPEQAQRVLLLKFKHWNLFVEQATDLQVSL